MAVKKGNKILDALMRAFNAKDTAEVAKLAEEVKDEGEFETGEIEGGDTHIHVHAGGNGEGETGRAAFTDQDIQAHMDQNAAEHEEMRSRIEALEKLIAGQGGAAEDGGEDLDKEIMDEVPEEFKEEAAKAKDSAYMADSFKDTVAMAEILVPGIRIPTFDRAAKAGKSFKQICSLRRQALDLAYAQPTTRGILDELLGGKPLTTASMTCDATRNLFRSASAMKRTMNNAQRVGDDQGSAKQAGPMTLAQLNARNAERYKS